MYEYKIKEIIRIYDGDTITAVIDLGFGLSFKEKFRLSYIDAPELKGIERPNGLISRDWLISKIDEAITNDIPIFIKTQKDRKGKYGRYLAEIFIEGVSINKLMISEGFAESY